MTLHTFFLGWQALATVAAVVFFWCWIGRTERRLAILEAKEL